MQDFKLVTVYIYDGFFEMYNNIFNGEILKLVVKWLLIECCFKLC